MINLSDYIASGSGGGDIALKTANHTASAGEFLLADTSGGSFSITLPASPALGDKVVIADPSDSWSVNDLFIGRNGATIEGLTEDLILDISGAKVALIYTGTTWRAYVEVRGASGDAITADSADTLANKVIHGDVNTMTADGTHPVASAILPLARQPSANASLLVSDEGKCVEPAGGVTLTVDDALHTARSLITIYNASTGNVTLIPNTTIAYIAGDNTNVTGASLTIPPAGLVTIYFRANAACVISGDVT